MVFIELGATIPAETAHAVSVSLPTWKSNVGYEEGERWVMDNMKNGYPRFFIHLSIQAFCEDIVRRHGQPGQRVMLFPTKTTGKRCLQYMRERAPESILSDVELLNLVLDSTKNSSAILGSISPVISAVICSEEGYKVAKEYWQHSGDGVSSRRAEFCHGLFKDGLLIPEATTVRSPRQSKVPRGPRRYQRQAHMEDGPNEKVEFGSDASSDEAAESLESSQFLEERFGRNLDISLVENAKSAIRRRIAGVLTTDVDLTTKLPTMNSNVRGVTNFREDDIYLVPCGMNAIFLTHHMLMKARGPQKSIEVGFPYVDTLKILQKFGPGCLFYPRAVSEELDELEARLKNGERFLALFCEFPGNPLLTCPDLVRIRRLADEYDIAVVVDETIGTFVNINVLPFADVVVSSLTKIFSGDANVMGGGIVLNPKGPCYDSLKKAFGDEFEDNYWVEDVIFMERNSRDFISRIDRVNINSEAIAETLIAHPNVHKVYYPKYNDTRPNYDVCKTPHGGYSGLLSCVFKTEQQAVAFYDAIDTAKGPSLGTNFTLTSPYVILAHYQELDWVKSLGVAPHLLRISVGLEDTEELKNIFTVALKASESV